MSENAKVSIIMPAYQSERTVAASISMAADQTYRPLEVIVVDDGSTDGTARIVDALANEIVKVVHQTNGGPSAARNAGIAVAQGDYIACCDADDLILPNHVSACMAALDRAMDERVFVTANAHMLTPTGIFRTLMRDPHPRPSAQRSAILASNFVSIFSIFPRSMLAEVGDFDESLRFCEDWDLWMRAVMAGWLVVRLGQPSAVYRNLGGSLSTQRDKMYDAEDTVLRRARERWARDMDPDDLAALDRRLQWGSPARMVSDAEQALRDGDHALARTLMERSSLLLPRHQRLKIKSTLMRMPGGPLLAGLHQRRIDRTTGFSGAMRR